MSTTVQIRENKQLSRQLSQKSKQWRRIQRQVIGIHTLEMSQKQITTFQTNRNSGTSFRQKTTDAPSSRFGSSSPHRKSSFYVDFCRATKNNQPENNCCNKLRKKPFTKNEHSNHSSSTQHSYCYCITIGRKRQANFGDFWSYPNFFVLDY